MSPQTAGPYNYEAGILEIYSPTVKRDLHPTPPKNRNDANIIIDAVQPVEITGNYKALLNASSTSLAVGAFSPTKAAFAASVSSRLRRRSA